MELENMTMEQLKAVAEQMGLDVKGLRKKADLMAAIEAAGAEPTPEAEPEAEMEPEPDDIKRLQVVYVGPNVPGGLLTNGKILYGTEKSIREYIEPVRAQFPLVEKLIVPIENANDARAKIQSRRGVLYKYTQDLFKV